MVSDLTALLNVVGAALIIMPVVTIVVQEAQGAGRHAAAPYNSHL
jgi:hypothetical protein